jgi:hypothetical protein
MPAYARSIGGGRPSVKNSPERARRQGQRIRSNRDCAGRKDCGLTSDRKIKTNRANARISTAPKTARGRSRSAKNAFRHGLNLPAQSDQAFCEEVQALADQIAGRNASAHIQMLARQVAQAQFDLRRVRYARLKFLGSRLADRYRGESATVVRSKLKVMKHFLTPKLANVPLPAFIENFITTTPPPDPGTILSKEMKQLLAMDRYERRALSRRKFAIRSFDQEQHIRLNKL